MADKTTTTIIALAALTAGAIGTSAILPEATAADVDDLCVQLVAEGVDCEPTLREAAIKRIRVERGIKRDKIIGVFDWIRENRPVVWAQIMTVVKANWDNAYPPAPVEVVEE